MSHIGVIISQLAHGYDMASVHCAAAAGCELPCDIIGNALREHHLLKEPFRFEDGCVVVPDAPGLGVELDMETIEKYRVPIEEETEGVRHETDYHRV